MRAHGFTPDPLAELVRIGFADQTSERVVGEWGQVIEIRRLTITEAGDRAPGVSQFANS